MSSTLSDLPNVGGFLANMVSLAFEYRLVFNGWLLSGCWHQVVCVFLRCGCFIGFRGSRALVFSIDPPSFSLFISILNLISFI